MAITISNLLSVQTTIGYGLKQSDSSPRRLSEAEVRSLPLYSPPPPYPFEARLHRLMGEGFVRLDVNVRTGYVISARMLQSTGHEILDKAALDAFRQWRFKPHTVSAVRIPVRFSLTRTNYGQLSGIAPIYPNEARAKGLTGSCVVNVRIDPRTGFVTSASILKSTGYDVLDRAALDAVRQWHFKPQAKTTAEIPIRFTPNGVVF